MTDREAWVEWLLWYSPEKFYDSFIRRAQDAKSTCQLCGYKIYLDIREGGGIPDWRTRDGDYGCGESPDNTDEGTGSHVPYKLPN